MIGNSHNSRGSSTFADSPLPRWRTVFIALLLTLTIGSTGPASTAQAASVNQMAWYVFTSQDGGQDFMCLGDTATFTVLVKLSEIEDNVISRGVGMPGIRVIGSVQDQNVGLLKAPTSRLTNSNSDQPGSAVFTFQANGYGETTLTFKAEIRNYKYELTKWLFGVARTAESVPIVVKVIPCKFDVNTVSIWKAGMTSVGTMDGEMKADEQGNFTGSASVNWVTSIIGSGGCRAESSIEPSKAELTGRINDSGQLVGEVTFGPTSASGFHICGPVGGSSDNSIVPDPLTIKASSDGVSVHTQAQAVTAKNGSFTGTATIVVIPVEDEAVSLISGNPKLSWDDFFSLFASVLALH